MDLYIYIYILSCFVLSQGVSRLRFVTTERILCSERGRSYLQWRLRHLVVKRNIEQKRRFEEDTFILYILII